MISHIIAGFIGAYFAFGGLFALVGTLADSFDQSLGLPSRIKTAGMAIALVVAWPYFIAKELRGQNGR